METPELFTDVADGSVDDKARDEARSAIDELIRNALAYHTPGRFVELMQFTRRLPRYSPFNCMLLHIQNPQVTYVARPEQWAFLGRKIKPGARPLVILAPMHPVLFVFDVADTEGKPLPPAVVREIEDPFGVEGTISALTWGRIVRLSGRLDIEVREEALGKDLAGDVRASGQGSPRYLIRLNAEHEKVMRFATLAHELGHLFCGHQGGVSGDFWVARQSLNLAGRELEAEAVAYLVSSRFGLHTASKKYLSLYLKPDAVLPDFSMEAILTAAGAVEDMANGKLPGKERARRRRESKRPVPSLAKRSPGVPLSSM